MSDRCKQCGGSYAFRCSHCQNDIHPNRDTQIRREAMADDILAASEELRKTPQQARHEAIEECATLAKRIANDPTLDGSAFDVIHALRALLEKESREFLR